MVQANINNQAQQAHDAKIIKITEKLEKALNLLQEKEEAGMTFVVADCLKDALKFANE